MLRISNLTKDFKGVQALKGVDCTVQKGQIHGLIGPNGSGKTTFFNVVAGILPPTAGKIIFKSKEISGLRAYVISTLGISRTFQKGFVVPSMTCLENVMSGAHGRTRPDILGTFLRLPLTASKQEERIKDKARRFLDLVGLSGFEDRWASELVWVERQLLQIARALAAEPVLLLLDEPTAGMGAEESARVERLCRRIVDMGVTIMLVSHDVNLVTRLADRITVLNSGEKICEGTPRQVQRDPRVLEAYLGTE